MVCRLVFSQNFHRGMKTFWKPSEVTVSRDCSLDRYLAIDEPFLAVNVILIIPLCWQRVLAAISAGRREVTVI
jgi:hypothetical protein